MTDTPDPMAGGCGHDIETLSDYLDRGMTPADPSIDDSPECQRMLRSLRRVRSLAEPLLEADVAAVKPLEQNWIRGIMETIGREVKAGRDIPFAASDDASTLVITEGTVRGLVRDAGDITPGVLVGKCVLDGEVTRIGAPIALRVTVSAVWGKPVPSTTDELRRNIIAAIRRHTDLVLTSVDIVVDDLFIDEGGAGGGWVR